MCPRHLGFESTVCPVWATPALSTHFHMRLSRLMGLASTCQFSWAGSGLGPHHAVVNLRGLHTSAFPHSTAIDEQHEELLGQWTRVFDRYAEMRQPDPKSTPLPQQQQQAGDPAISATTSVPSSAMQDAMRQRQRLDQAGQQQLPGGSKQLPGDPSSQLNLGELLRIFGARVGSGAMIPEQFSMRLVSFYSSTLRPEDRGWFFRLICDELGLSGEARLTL